MLQQTRADVVRHVWPKFIGQFPTPRSLAGADDDVLLSAWRGLGYYRRARFLREGAREVMTRHGGNVPDNAEELGALPGIGPYTAGAVASIAFGLCELAIDGNVLRVTARHRLIESNVRRGEGQRAVEAAVREWQDRQQPGDFNQALMELGATTCLARSPKCEACPVSEDCQGRQQGLLEQLPQLPKAPLTIEVLSRAILVSVDGGRILGTRVPDGSINAGQVDLPGPGPLADVESAEDLERELRGLYGVHFEVGEVLARIRHSITNHKITLVVHQASCDRGPGPNLMAARPDDPSIPWTTTARKSYGCAPASGGKTGPTSNIVGSFTTR